MTNYSCHLCKHVIKIGVQGGLRCFTCAEYFHNLCVKIPLESLPLYEKKQFKCPSCSKKNNKVVNVLLPKSIDKPKKAKKNVSEQSIEDRLSRLESRFEELLKQIKGGNESLANTISEIRSDFKSLQSRSTRIASQHDVIISNIPELKNEDTLAVARFICKSLNSSISDTEVLQANRFEAKNGPRYIKATLGSRESKEELIRKSRKNKLTLGDSNMSSSIKKFSKTSPPIWCQPQQAAELLETATIYVNESVSKKTRSLLLDVLKLKNDKSIFSVWTWRNRVYYKMKQEDKPTLCTSADHFAE